MPEHIHLMTVGELIVFSVVLIVTGILFVLFCMAPEEKREFDVSADEKTGTKSRHNSDW